MLQDYVDYLNIVFNRTITDSQLVLLEKTSPIFVVTCLQNKDTRALELKPRGWLHFRQVVSVQSRNAKYRKVVVEEGSYRYSLSPNLGDEDQWIFRYEYCLTPNAEVPYSHLHVNASRGNWHMKGIHFPTARVSIEQIIAHLIIEYRVQSKSQGWLEYLAESHGCFMEQRTDIPSQMFP